MGIPGLIIALAVMWAVGTAFVAALPRRTALFAGAGAVPWSLGAGGYAGALLATLWLRALSLAGVPFGFAAVMAPLAFAGALLGWWAWRREGAVARAAFTRAWRTFHAHGLVGRARWLWWLLLAWLAMRFALLLTDVVLQPLYPWDAWTQWATKARVWYELGRIAPFVPAAEWFASDQVVYRDAAPHYPGTVPLLQVFACVALGRWDDALMNLPFWVLAVALALAMYGALRAVGFGALGALIGAWLTASLPLANVHVALAGYADLPLAGCVALAVLAAYRWHEAREPGDGILALFFVAALPLVKIPGRIWALVLLAGLIVALLPRYGLKIVGTGLAGALLGLVVLSQTHPVILGYTLHLDLAPEWNALAESYLLLGNWHLLWYGAVAIALLGWRQALSPRIAPLSIIVGTGAIFLFIVFNFTNAVAWVADQTTVNRATLHIAPVIVFWMLIVFRAWFADLSARETAAAATVAGPDPLSGG
jgi:hypothetical protein